MLHHFRILFFLTITLFSAGLSASSDQDFPVLYKGRFRPAEAYARLWLNEIYHSQSLKNKDQAKFALDSSDALDVLWKLHFLGPSSLQEAPLFWIQSAEIKRAAQLDLKQNRFSYQDLRPLLDQELNPLSNKAKEEWTQLNSSLRQFKSYGYESQNEETPLKTRLQLAGKLFHSLPSKYPQSEWYSLHALKVYPKNFTHFTDEQFETIRKAYLDFEKSVISKAPLSEQSVRKQLFTSSLLSAYQTMAGETYQEAEGKGLNYPSLGQLKLETWYYVYPVIKMLILLYCLSAFFLYFSKQSKTGSRLAFILLCITFLAHTALLIWRSYILNRPPVTNMSETVIYVPWVAVLASLVLNKLRNNRLILIAACLTAIILLTILELTGLDTSLDQVQAVLDSQFWLIIHVLMIVGSYGVFILGALLGHFYLGSYLYYKYETPFMRSLSQMILQTMYLGTTLLIPGTILGGIWAAESWGRFWDWDPKESWAFISSCIYLIWIHAYRFNRIASFGLAIGAVSGCLAISFTWYGVNYILGAGLHSYGFGSGGEIYYYSFVIAELVLIGWALVIKNRQSSLANDPSL
jgi:ABC-type transport system involved in cytochrome c biogenesis permease subunit